MILAEKVSFSYRRKPLLTDISLRVEAGQCFALTGPNGTGKSTLLRLLTGLLRPQTGHIALWNIAPSTRATHWHRRVGLLIEKPALYGHLSGADHLRVWCRYFGMPDQRIAEVLEFTGLTGVAHVLTRRYSTGMKQRLGIAQTLLTDPELLIWDEPLNGLDPEWVVRIRQLIHHLHRERGKTILLSSHLLGELEHTCTHACILQQGHLRWQGALADLAGFGAVRLRVQPPAGIGAVQAWLQNSGCKITALHDNLWEVEVPRQAQLQDVLAALIGHRWRILHIETAVRASEAHYLHMLHEHSI